jgi:photosynthetic reaction center cytochrome c subunit
MKRINRVGSGLALLLTVVLTLSGCERPPIETVQTGYRGTGMAQVYNPRLLEDQAAINRMPEIDPPARVREGPPKAGAVYQNVKVLGDLSLAEFGRTMNAMTNWVSPGQSCAYCHVEGNFADDSKYTKVVARRMIQMTQHLNADWKSHVGETGVTCYTCHRGQNLPQPVWFKSVPERTSGLQPILGARAGQNAPSSDVALSSLPNLPFEQYLLSEDSARTIRVASNQALPSGNTRSTKQAEHTYGLMMHMSQSLGVNCTYCHNTRNFASWDESRPQRATAWHGIRMVRDVNHDYLDPLAGVFPANLPGRLGPMQDTAKVNCGTCHKGAFKPMYGAQMAKAYPALLSPSP